MLIVVVEGTIFQPTNEFCCCRASPFPGTHQHQSFSDIIMTYCLKGYWSRIRNVVRICMDTSMFESLGHMLFEIIACFITLQFAIWLGSHHKHSLSVHKGEKNIWKECHPKNQIVCRFGFCNSFSSARKGIKTRRINFMNTNQDM